MRIFTEVNVRHLGQVPGIERCIERIRTEFDLVSADTKLNERVFFGTHRLVAQNKYVQHEQKYSTGQRSERLLEIVEPQLEFLQSVYQHHVPVLVQCATLPAGASLMWHHDTYLYQDVSHKVHIPLITNPDATFEIMGLVTQKLNFKVGYAYEINNIRKHRSVNAGAEARTHLIVDLMPEQQLQEFIDQNVDFFFTHHEQNKSLENEA